MEVLLPLDHLPLGFRFRPTDEELINHYLKGKISGRGSGIEVIPEVDVCKCEPWDLPDKSIIRADGDSEWFFFVPRDRKYPNGQRSNRATEAGYWKATGKDRKIKSRSLRSEQIGTKKTLVFYRGRAPNGERTNWIMHEYRANENGLNSNEGPQGAFVLCRLFRKPEEKTENPSLHVENSSWDVVDPSGFSPATSKSSPEDLLMDTDDPTSKKASPHLAEGTQPLFAVTESGELIDVDKWLEELLDNGTPDPPPMQIDLKCGNDMEGPDQDAPVSSFEPALQSLDSNVPLESSDGGLPSDDWQHTGNPNACVEQNVSKIWEQWFNSIVDEFPEEWTENSVEDVGVTGIKIRNRKHHESDSDVVSLQGSAPRRILLQSKMVKMCHSDLDPKSEAEAAEINVSEIYGTDSDHEAEAEVTEARGRLLKHVSDAKPGRILPDQVSVAATPPANRNHLWPLNRRQRKDKAALQQDEHGEVESPNKSVIESSSFGRRSRDFQSKPSMSSSGSSFVASNSKTRLGLAVLVCLAILIILILLTAVWGDLIV